MGIFEDKSIIGKGKVKQGAIVGQDHGFIKWENENIIFDVYDFMKNRKILIADGYGNLKKPNKYGNGSLFVKDEDVIMLSEEEMKLSHYDHEKDLIKSKDLGDYYWTKKEGIEAEINEVLEILSPYNGKKHYAERLIDFAQRLTEIAEMAERLAEEF